MRIPRDAEKQAKSNQSVEKTLAILDVLSQQTEPKRLYDLAKLLSMNPSTLLRFLTTLQRAGYVRQDPSSRYAITMKICALASDVAASIQPLRQICAQHLSRLSRFYKQAAILAVEQDMQVLYLEVINDVTKMLNITQRVGHTAPMHCTGSGKLLMLNFDEEQMESYFRRGLLEAPTAKSITNKDQLLRELEVVRVKGYAVDDEEMLNGIRCVAVPVYDYTQRIAAAISISGPRENMTDALVYDRLEFLIKVGSDASRDAGYRG